MSAKKNKCQFNTDTLEYEKPRKGIRRIMWEIIQNKFFWSLLIGITIFFIVLKTIELPNEKAQIQQGKQLRYHYKSLDIELTKLNKVLSEIQNRDDNLYRNIFETSEISSSLRKTRIAGVNRYKSLKGFKNSANVINVWKSLDFLSKKIYVQSMSLDTIANYVNKSEEMSHSIPFMSPVDVNEITKFGPFGMRIHPILHIYILHQGNDFCTKQNTKIIATGDGVVTSTNYNRGLGNYLEITHEFNYVSWYGHVSEVLVKSGQKVKRGDVIALVGATGISNTPHLHYEIHKNGEPIDPVKLFQNYLTENEFKRIISVSSNDINAFYD